MKHLFTLAFSFLFLFTAKAQGLDQLEFAAKDYIKAIKMQDYASIVDLTYPNIITLAGDKDYFVKLIKSQRDSYEEAGMKLTSASFESSSPVVKAGEELHAIVTMVKKFEISGQMYKGNAFLLAITPDKGKTWQFVDLETFDKDGIKDFVPSYNHNLPFPMQEGAVLIDPSGN